MRPTLVTVAALTAVVTAGAVDAWRTATAHGWFAAGFDRLVRDAFWDRFDRTAPIALALLLAGGILSTLRRRRGPERATLVGPALVIALAALGRGAGHVQDSICPHRPNVVLISIDTLRPDRLGTYGYGRPTSPILDARLTRDGVVFEQAWSQSPKTTPSHMTMFTSLHPSTHGIGLWDGLHAAPALSPKVHTLAEALKNAGYTTAAFTAGAHMHRDRGFVQGFDVYKHGMQLERTLEFLAHRRRRPFFLFFHTYEVHDPYLPAPEIAATFVRAPVPAIAAAVDRVRAGVDGWGQAHKLFWAPVQGSDPAHVQHLSDLYDADIRQMDGETLTALLDALDRLDLADDTFVVFTSDHGEAFHEHGRFLHDDLSPEVLRVPLVLRFPGWLPSGRRVPDPVGLVDLAPTILDLLTLPPLPDAQGTSLAPLARGDEGATAPETILADFTTPTRRYERIRRGDIAVVRENDAVTFVDVARDPGEHAPRPVDDAAPREAMLLRTLLDRWHETNLRLADRLGPQAEPAVAPSADTVEHLRALGYVQ